MHRYDFGTVHAVARGIGFSIDVFMYGLEPLGLLGVSPERPRVAVVHVE